MTTPHYNPLIPASREDTIADTQDQFLSNFQALYNSFAKDHVSLNAPDSPGNHLFVQMLEQVTQGRQTGAGEMAMYAKDVENQADQLFIRNQFNAPEIQYTNYQIYRLTPTPTQTGFFTFLPGKVIVYFGTANIKSSIGSPEVGAIFLDPPITTNIITMTCGLLVQRINAFKPYAIPVKNDKGVFTRIDMFSPTLFGFTYPIGYLVMGNI